MYTLLLVDDEEEVTQIIAKKVKWNELGFSVVGHANNGLKAMGQKAALWTPSDFGIFQHYK